MSFKASPVDDGVHAIASSPLMTTSPEIRSTLDRPFVFLALIGPVVQAQSTPTDLMLGQLHYSPLEPSPSHPLHADQQQPLLSTVSPPSAGKSPALHDQPPGHRRFYAPMSPLAPFEGYTYTTTPGAAASAAAAGGAGAMDVALLAPNGDAGALALPEQETMIAPNLQLLESAVPHRDPDSPTSVFLNSDGLNGYGPDASMDRMPTPPDAFPAAPPPAIAAIAQPDVKPELAQSDRAAAPVTAPGYGARRDLNGSPSRMHPTTSLAARPGFGGRVSVRVDVADKPDFGTIQPLPSVPIPPTALPAALPPQMGARLYNGVPGSAPAAPYGNGRPRSAAGGADEGAFSFADDMVYQWMSRTGLPLPATQPNGAATTAANPAIPEVLGAWRAPVDGVAAGTFDQFKHQPGRHHPRKQQVSNVGCGPHTHAHSPR